MELEVALDKLAGLGNADAIAEFLKEEGIKGRQGFPYACPVSRYLQRECNTLTYVTAFTTFEHHLLDNPIKTPAPVVDFVIYFDNGVYQELIEQ